MAAGRRVAAATGAPPAVLEALASGFTAYTDDYAEGVTAFLTNKEPRFRGR